MIMRMITLIATPVGVALRGKKVGVDGILVIRYPRLHYLNHTRGHIIVIPQNDYNTLGHA